jgi:hypothetical protein
VKPSQIEPNLYLTEQTPNKKGEFTLEEMLRLIRKNKNNDSKRSMTATYNRNMNASL